MLWLVQPNGDRSCMRLEPFCPCESYPVAAREQPMRHRLLAHLAFIMDWPARRFPLGPEILDNCLDAFDFEPHDAAPREGQYNGAGRAFSRLEAHGQQHEHAVFAVLLDVAAPHRLHARELDACQSPPIGRASLFSTLPIETFDDHHQLLLALQYI